MMEKRIVVVRKLLAPRARNGVRIEVGNVILSEVRP